jgi:glutamine phosphoribosylpyrophosphate amidotransferase
MCGIIGIWMQNVEWEDLALVEHVFYESQIRGKHATGFSYVLNSKVRTIKEPIPVEDFFGIYNLSDFINEDGGLYIIGHTRYSTSDLKYNQPLSNKQISIAHNGVISQEPRDEWMYETETGNDSELILKSLENDSHPFIDFPNSSMAVCSIDYTKKLTCFRNHERPLWYSTTEKGVIFTSTQDIANRAGLDNPVKTKMLHNYTVENGVIKEYNCVVPFNIDYLFEDLQ